MGHLEHLPQKPYHDLIKRLNQYQIGVPDTQEIYKILQILYTKDEARVGSKFPLGPASLKELSYKTHIDIPRLEQILEAMAQKGVVIDFTPRETKLFLLAPSIFGFFEFTFMRLNSDLPLGEIAQLMEKSFRNEMGREFFASKTPMARTLVYEKSIPNLTRKVNSYQQVSDIIRRVSYYSIQPCFCRRKAGFLNKACKAPVEVCMGLGFAAEYLVRRGFAKRASQTQMLKVLDNAEKLGLIHLTDNVKDDPTFICHCCGCCCELLQGINDLQINHAVSPTDFIADIDKEKCSGCGLCIDKCHVRAINLTDKSNEKKAGIQKERCLGCSACISDCKRGAIYMKKRQRKIYIPKNSFIRYYKIAKDKKRLKPFLFYIASKILKGEVSDAYNFEGK